MPITLKDDSNLEAPSAPPAPRTDLRQRHRMLLAMAVLLVAVIIVFVKDRELWFASTPGPDSDANQTAAPSAPGPAPSLPAVSAVTPSATPPATKKRPSQQAASPASNAAAPMISATERAVLPPLEVEVVAGNQHQPLAASNTTVKVEMQPSNAAGDGQTNAPASSPAADAHVSLSQDTTQRVTRTVEPNYPLLAKQMKVQGAVVLQALIDKSGHIQDLHVVSGPTILAAAAREAVKQWHFKPYFQGGQAVETEARITVNFTISTY